MMILTFICKNYRNCGNENSCVIYGNLMNGLYILNTNRLLFFENKSRQAIDLGEM